MALSGIPRVPLQTTTEQRHDIVSDDSEALILVNSDDEEIGSLDKSACHDGDGVLHRAFSLFVFNADGELLLQRRSQDKRLWPGYWSNSCCSHPRVGETMADAVQRRCQQELGFTTQLEFVYKFEYSAQYENEGTEHELCSVYVGQHTGALDINASEIEDVQWMAPATLDNELAENPKCYSPWLKLEWARLRADYPERLPI